MVKKLTDLVSFGQNRQRKDIMTASLPDWSFLLQLVVFSELTKDHLCADSHYADIAARQS